jgi:hypothetical protein
MHDVMVVLPSGLLFSWEAFKRSARVFDFDLAEDVWRSYEQTPQAFVNAFCHECENKYSETFEHFLIFG